MEQLEYFGIPAYIIRIWKKHYSDTLLPVQEKAVRQFNILQDNHARASYAQYQGIAGALLVISPSSSGKTLVGEMAAIQEISLRKKVIFLVPLRILAEEKYKHFLHLYQPIGLKVKVSSSDHRYDDQDIINGNFHIAVIVYEKFYYLQLQYPQFLENVSLLIADEIQLINDAQRGPRLENSVNYLRAKHPDIRMIALSALTENVHNLAVWLKASVLFSAHRPVELRKGIIRNGIFKYIEHNTRIRGKEVFFNKNEVQECNLASYLNATLKYLVGRNETNLIFFPTRREARLWSNWLANQINLPPAQTAINKLRSIEDSSSREELLFLLQKSIAYHCADLSRQERRLLEEAVCRREIKIICATDTLSMGINLPVNNVILTGQKVISEKNNKFLLTSYQKRSLTISEVENMGGRAGRLSQQNNFGRIIFLAPSLIELTAYQKLYFNHPVQTVNSTSQYCYPALQENSFHARENFIDKHDIDQEAIATVSTILPTRSAISEKKLVKVEYDALTFFLHMIAQNYHSIGDINAINQNAGGNTERQFWHHKFYQKINKTEILKQLEKEELIKHDNDNFYYITDMGSLIVSRGICFNTYIHFQKWFSSCHKNDISELEILFLIANSSDGENFFIPSPGNRKLKNKKPLTDKWKEYLRMQMLSLVFELGEDNKPIFQISLDTYSNQETNINRKNDLKKILAIKKTLLMFDWINGRELREIEEDYGILNGAIQKIGEGFSWLVDTLAAIARKIGWREYRAADLNKINQLSERLITGIEPDGLALARLQIPDLTRAYIQKMVQEGYDNKQCLEELDEKQLSHLLPKRLIQKIKKHLRPDKSDKAEILSSDNKERVKHNLIGLSDSKLEEFRPVLIINQDRPDRIFFLQETIAVNRTNFQLILLLVRNKGKMISYDYIINTLWPDDEDATYHRLWYHLGKLRNNMQKIILEKKLSNLPDKYIREKILKVFPGRGLLLDVNVAVEIEK